MSKENTHIVGPETVRMLELGHPWVVADGYTKKWPQGSPGQIIALTDNQERFLATALLDPHERIVARVLDFRQIKVDQQWLKKRIAAAIELRKHCRLDCTTAYRVVNAEGDGLPGLTIDRYGDYLMLQLYSAAWRPHLKLATQCLKELLSPTGIYEKSRPQKTRELEAVSDSKNYGRLLAGKGVPPRLTVLENGLHYHVSLENGLNTGLFLDQRCNRLDLMTRVKGKRVLNLFAYTGAFSVAAAAAGAAKVTSVDASPTYTDWAKENFSANGIKPGQHNFIVGDCFQVLAKLKQSGEKFDVILMDPPSFSTTAKNRFTTRGGTSDIAAAALHLLEYNGLLISSSNHQKVDLADYLKELRRGALQASCDLRVIAHSGQADDFPYPVTFPEGRYLKYVQCVKVDSGKIGAAS